MTGDIEPGERVSYAGAPYEVVAVHGDLLSLRGVAYATSAESARCRMPCVVLASDVARIGTVGGEDGR